MTYLDERDRKDYFRPSQRIFERYCADIVSRYHLAYLVHQAVVQDITYELDEVSNSKIFTLKTSTGIRRARAVVLAVGAALERKLPANCPFCDLALQGSVEHAFVGSMAKLPPHVQVKMDKGAQTNVLVVGGGLTSCAGDGYGGQEWSLEGLACHAWAVER